MKLINDITFHNPEYLWFLILPISHVLWKILLKREEHSSIKHSNLSLFSSKKNIKIHLSFLPYLLKIISLIFIVISVARPQTTNSWEESKT